MNKKDRLMALLVVSLIWLAIIAVQWAEKRKIKECNNKWWVIFFITDVNEKRISEDICSISIKQ